MRNHTFVTSSNIDSVGYDEDTLFVRFKSGESYSYDGVPFFHFDGMTKAESVGKYFHRHVKGYFRYTHLKHDPFVR